MDTRIFEVFAVAHAATVVGSEQARWQRQWRWTRRSKAWCAGRRRSRTLLPSHHFVTLSGSSQVQVHSATVIHILPLPSRPPHDQGKKKGKSDRRRTTTSRRRYRVNHEGRRWRLQWLWEGGLCVKNLIESIRESPRESLGPPVWLVVGWLFCHHWFYNL